VRRCLFCLALLSIAVTAAAQPRDYGDLHPRLLVDPAMLAALPDSIAADPVKAGTWAGMLSTAEVYQSVPVSIVFGSNYGFSTAPALGLTALLAEEPLAGAIRQQLLDATALLIESEGVWGSGDELAAAIRLRTLLLMYDMVFAEADSQLTADLLAEVRDYIRTMTTDFVFYRGLYNPYCSNHSIAIGATLIQAELCLRDDWPGDIDLTIARILGEALVAKGMTDLLGSDGSYGEGGLYLAYCYRLLAPVYAAALRLDGEPLWDAAKLEATLEWAAYMLIPESGTCLNRNDCSEYSRPFALHSTLWHWAQTALPDPRFARWLQDKITGPGGFDFGSLADGPAALLWHRAGPLLAPGDFLPPERLFPDQGLYVYRRGWPGDPLAESLQFTLQAGKFWGGHWQEDVGHFTLRAFGEVFGMDNGPGGNALETEAHSLPLIDGLGQHNAGSSIGTDGQLALRVDRGFCRVLQVDMAPAYNGHSPFNDPDYPLPGSDWSWGYDGGNPLERANRWVILLPGAAPAMPVFYLLDDLRKDGAPHDYAWRLQHAMDLTLAVDGERYTLTGGGGRLEADLLWPAPAATSWSDLHYDNANSDPDSRSLAVAQSAVDGRFLWQLELLAPGAPSQPLAVQRFATGLRATSGASDGWRRELVAAWEPILVAPGTVLAGRFGLVEAAPSGQQRSLLVDGTELRLDDRLYIGMAPAGWAVVDADTVWLSGPEHDFAIYSPTAVAVMAGELPVAFTRDGDYLHRGDWTALPEAPARRRRRPAAPGPGRPRRRAAAPGALRSAGAAGAPSPGRRVRRRRARTRLGRPGRARAPLRRGHLLRAPERGQRPLPGQGPAAALARRRPCQARLGPVHCSALLPASPPNRPLPGGKEWPPTRSPGSPVTESART
jgi:hypothetical protein